VNDFPHLVDLKKVKKLKVKIGEREEIKKLPEVTLRSLKKTLNLFTTNGCKKK